VEVAAGLMVEVVYKGRLGNNLFQYSFGRILAQRLGFELRAEPIPGFAHTADVVAGDRHESPALVPGEHLVDVGRLSEARPPARIVLNGWFQRHEYYRPHRDQVRKWLAFDDTVTVPASRPDTVVHVRRTDYVGNGWALPFSFYQEAMSRLRDPGEVWILADDPTDPFFRRFDRWRPRYSRGTALADLRFMSAARQIVMSQSAFSWWASFLGDPERVLCPVPSFGIWASSGADVSLIERDRFECVPCPDPYQPSVSESWYQRRRALRPAVARTYHRWFPVPLRRIS